VCTLLYTSVAPFFVHLPPKGSGAGVSMDRAAGVPGVLVVPPDRVFSVVVLIFSLFLLISYYLFIINLFIYLFINL